MTALTSRFFFVPCAVALAVLTGCGGSGNQASGKATASPRPTAATGPTLVVAPTSPAVPTATPAPTAVLTGGDVAAVVNGHSVPMSTFRLLVSLDQHRAASQPGGISPAQLTQAAMNQLVVSELVQQYANAHHITLSNAAVQKEIQKDEKLSGGARPFDQRLAQIGLNRSSFKTLLAPSLLQQKVANKIFPLSTSPRPIAHVRHILIMPHPVGAPVQPGQPAPTPRTDAQAKALAERLLAQIQHGGDFAVLAKKYSDDTGSGAQGGYLAQCCSPGQTVPPFDHAAFTLKLNRPVIVHSQFGYHIMEVLSRGKAPLPLQQQQQSQQQKFSTWIAAQQKAAKIQKIAQVKKA
ncbi:MAG: peptidylprolyl isomerase [Chloroflexota bacterium]|nr:peptidylprolyl isomerase [Chloroflexota bacterium]